jgi:DMSO/TMAO reductase YedYZ molybdopterin-dependent catalytic subunit
MMNNLSIVALAILIIVATYVISAAYLPGVKALSPAEIRNYQGQKLSSINDVVDNAIAGTQRIDASSYILSVYGPNGTKTYTYGDVLNLTHYQKVVTLHCVEGWDATILWEGALVRDLLNATGNASTVIFYASDGYSTSLSLDYILNDSIILAYKMNGVTLPKEKGFPFQLIAESKYGYKWIKWVTKIELSSNDSYQGYWESRGYSNGADLK